MCARAFSEKTWSNVLLCLFPGRSPANGARARRTSGHDCLYLCPKSAESKSIQEPAEVSSRNIVVTGQEAIRGEKLYKFWKLSQGICFWVWKKIHILQKSQGKIDIMTEGNISGRYIDGQKRRLFGPKIFSFVREKSGNTYVFVNFKELSLARVAQCFLESHCFEVP